MCIIRCIYQEKNSSFPELLRTALQKRRFQDRLCCWGEQFEAPETEKSSCPIPGPAVAMVPRGQSCHSPVTSSLLTFASLLASREHGPLSLRSCY